MVEFIEHGIQYCSVEQYIIAKKALLMGDNDTYNIVITKSDADLKLLEKNISPWFEDKWLENKKNIMYRANLYKYVQNRDLIDMLLSPENPEPSYRVQFKESLLHKEFQNAFDEYELYSELEIDGAPPMPEFYGYDIGRQEGNYDCMMSLMFENLDEARTKLKYICNLIIENDSTICDKARTVLEKIISYE